MDRFSFRVWDTRKNYMFHSTNDYWFNDEESTLTFQMSNIIGDHDDGHRFIIMQFTGRTDSKDKEIFEGDILMARGEKGTVKWETDRFIVYSNWLGLDVYFPLHSYSSNEMTVIGNIYQGEEPPLIYGQQANETA